MSPQVIPDWRHPSAHAEEGEPVSKKLQRLSDHKASVHKFFEERDNLGGSVKSKAATLPPRTANRFFVLSKDNALRQGAGLSLKYFEGPRRSWALQPGDRRYTAPNPMADLDGEPPFRSCVRRASGKDEFEVPRLRLADGRDFRPALHCAQDEGSIGLPSMFWELQKVSLRGSFTEDEWHRTMNDLGNAVRDAGVWTFILEWGCVANFRAGPWKGASFLQTLKGACTVYFKDHDETDELFASLYDRIAGDFGMAQDIDFGTRSHMKRVFNMCVEHDVWKRKGTKMKMGRWASWYICMEEMRQGRHLLLLALVLVGLRQGWWASLAASPLFRVDQLVACPDADDELPAAAEVVDPERPPTDRPAPEEPERQSVAASNKDINQKKGACHNLMHFSAMVLARPQGGRIVDMLCLASSIIRRDFWEGIKECSTKEGALLRDIGLSRGMYAEVLAETVQLWSKPDILAKLDILPAECPFADDLSAEMEMERALAKHWFWWMLRVVDHRMASVGTWTHSYPHHFVGLLSKDQEVRDETMQEVKDAFQLLEKLEARSHVDAWVRTFLQELMWTSDVFVRETFVDLIEHQWQTPLEGGLDQRLRAFAFANKRTKIQEDLFKIIKKRQSLSDANFCSRRGRWDSAVRSGLIQRYDRVDLEVTAEAKDISPKSLPAMTYECKAVSRFSLGEEMLDTMQASNPSWSSPSPEAYKLRAEAWAAALHVSGDTSKLRMCWLSLLAMPGRLLYHQQLLNPGASTRLYYPTHVEQPSYQKSKTSEGDKGLGWGGKKLRSHRLRRLALRRQVVEVGDIQHPREQTGRHDLGFQALWVGLHVLAAL